MGGWGFRSQEGKALRRGRSTTQRGDTGHVLLGNRGLSYSRPPVAHALLVWCLLHLTLGLLELGVVDFVLLPPTARRLPARGLLGGVVAAAQKKPAERGKEDDGEDQCEGRGGKPQTSRFRTNFAFSSMNLRRGSTSSPMSVSNSCEASSASSIVTFRSVRLAGSMVVSRSWSGFISPRPL